MFSIIYFNLTLNISILLLSFLLSILSLFMLPYYCCALSYAIKKLLRIDLSLVQPLLPLVSVGQPQILVGKP